MFVKCRLSILVIAKIDVQTIETDIIKSEIEVMLIGVFVCLFVCVCDNTNSDEWICLKLLRG